MGTPYAKDDASRGKRAGGRSLPALPRPSPPGDRGRRHQIRAATPSVTRRTAASAGRPCDGAGKPSPSPIRPRRAAIAALEIGASGAAPRPQRRGRTARGAGRPEALSQRATAAAHRRGARACPEQVLRGRDHGDAGAHGGILSHAHPADARAGWGRAYDRGEPVPATRGGHRAALVADTAAHHVLSGPGVNGGRLASRRSEGDG